MARAVPETLKIQRLLCICMVWAAWSGGSRIIEHKKVTLHFHGLGGVVKGAGGPRITENTRICLYLHCLGGVVKGAGGPRIIENTRMFLCIFMVSVAW